MKAASFIPSMSLFSRHKKLLGMVLLGIFIVGLFVFTLKDLPSPTKLASNELPQSSQIFDRNGTLLYTIYGNKNQTFVPLSQIPKYMQEATIAIEDKDFYKHGAIDVRGTARAFIDDLMHKQIQQGGSTLTQQLVKNTLLTQERTLPRKIKEILLSFATELIYSKPKILEMYLNQTPYGGTSYGVEAAAQTYFGKHANQLDLAETAMLAGLPQSPSTFSPFGAYPQLGKQRQTEVLAQMQKQGYISASQMQQAEKETLHFNKIHDRILAPHFVLYVRDLLEQKYGEQLVETGGLKVTTSLDLPIQNYAQQAVANGVAEVKQDHVTNGAALVTDPKTGEILAMVGSTDYFNIANDGNVNITTALRQPGSSIKPINYAIGIADGYPASTPFIDEATCFGGNGTSGGSYCPKNYDLKWHGVVTMRQALGNSFNIPAVKMLKVNTVPAMLASASAMGITTFTDPSRYGLSLTLGGGEVRMVDMAVAYGVFANMGYRVDLHPILKVTDKNNRVLDEYKPGDSSIFGTRIMDPGVAFIISDILADNNARLTEFGPSSALKISGHFVSAKTGTTNDFKDNWTFGYTPSVLVSTWVGNNDSTPMNGLASGITGAAPIFHDIMSYMLKNKPQERPQIPGDVVKKGICSGQGTPGQPQSCQGYDYGLKNVPIPKTFGYTNEAVFVDKSTNDLAKPGQTDNVEPRQEEVVTDPTGAKYCLTCAHPSPSPTP